MIKLRFPEQPNSLGHWWLIVETNGEVDLCSIDPGAEVDLYATTDLRTMTSIWLGLCTLGEAQSKKRLTTSGDADLADNMDRWLGLSAFASEKKRSTGGMVIPG